VKVPGARLVLLTTASDPAHWSKTVRDPNEVFGERDANDIDDVRVLACRDPLDRGAETIDEVRVPAL
jgi:hypothetical protein